MKYKKGQKVVIISGILTGLAGWIIECDNPAMATIGMPYLVGLDESNEWMPEDYLMSLDELQQLRAENNELKAALRIIQRETQEMIGYFKDQTFVVQSEVFDSFETVETIVSRVLGGLDIELWKDVE